MSSTNDHSGTRSQRPLWTWAAVSRRRGRYRIRRWFARLAQRPTPDSAGIVRLQRRYIYILPSAYGLLLGGLLLLMLLGSLNYQNNLALLLTFLAASVALVSMLHAWLNLLDLKLSARGGPPVFAGQDAFFTFFLSDDGARARADLEIHIGKRHAEPLSLTCGGAGTAGISVPTAGRGWADTAGLLIQSRYPLGLFRAWSYPQSNVRVRVYPRPALSSPTPYPVPTVKSSEQGDLGVGADDFSGPRAYRPGDSPRRLDWKALARERGLIIKQFGGDRAVQVWLDWDRLPAVGTESRLSLLCRQVLDCAQQGLSYGLHLPGADVPMGQGEVHKHRCLECLADFANV